MADHPTTPTSRTRAVPRTLGAALRSVLGTTLLGIGLMASAGLGVLHLAADIPPSALASGMRPGWLLLSLLLFLLGNLLVGPRFVSLLPPGATPRPSGLAVGSIFVAGQVFNLLFPGPTSEIAAIATLRERYRIPVSDSLATSIHTRFAGLFVGGLLAGLSLCFIPAPGTLGQLVRSGFALLAGAGIALGLVSARPRLLIGLGERMSRILSQPSSGILGRLLARTGPGLAWVAGGLQRVWHVPLSRWLVVLGWSLIIQLVQVASLVAAARGLDLAPSLWSLVLVQGAGNLALLAAIMIPGGLGSYEIVFLSALTAAGGLPLAQSGWLLIITRIIHLSGLGLASLFFVGWARILLSPEVLDAVESRALGSPPQIDVPPAEPSERPR